jgi:probable F420-dependent oxidoreductase
MKISVGLPTTGPTASPQSIAEAARHAEAANLHRLWTVDRLLRPADGTAYVDEHYKCAFDPIETLVWVAARTTQIGLGTSIVLLPFQNPVVLARRLATLDHLSDGRALIGLGLGHMPQEFEVAGVPRSERGARFEEGLAAMRAAWGPDPVEFCGRFTRIPLADIGPKPLQPKGVPIIVGGESDVAVRRAGRLGLGINPILQEQSALRGLIDVWRLAVEGAGYDPATLDVVLRTNLLVGENRTRTRLGYAAWPVPELVDDLHLLEAMGVTEIFYELHDATRPISELVNELAEVKRRFET